MKKLLILLIAAIVYVSSSVVGFAQTPTEQLSQMVEQLQKKPDDKVLREKIIKFALEMKPAPTMPEEAIKRISRGIAAFEGAKSVTDYQDAIKEFQAAVDAAPWYGDAYLKLGFTQDKAEEYANALQNLKWAQMASPDAKNIKTLIYEVEYRNEKANSPQAKADAKQAAIDALAKQFEGNWYRMAKGGNGTFRSSFTIARDSAGKWLLTGLMFEVHPDMKPFDIRLEGTELKFKEKFIVGINGSAGTIEYVASVSSDGGRLKFTFKDLPTTSAEDKVRADWLPDGLNHRFSGNDWLKQ